MRTLSTTLACPSCQESMQIRALGCSSCEVEIRGTFAANEFSRLGVDDLHFLRIFVLAEGRIREMEAPLGLSYPTIRNRLGQLKEKLMAATHPDNVAVAAAAPPQTPSEVLEQLERGEIDFAKALESIQTPNSATPASPSDAKRNPKDYPKK